MSESMLSIISWVLLAAAAIVVLYLLWGVIRYGVKALIYLALLLLVLLMLNRAGFLPEEISSWLDWNRIVSSVQQQLGLPPESQANRLSEEGEALEPASYL